MGGYNFDKDLFRKRVRELVKLDSKVSIEDANPVQIYKAVGFAIKEQIIDPWIDTRKKAKEQDVKMVYYLSMEFLMGRALGNNDPEYSGAERYSRSSGGIRRGSEPDRGSGTRLGVGKRRSGTAGSLLPGFSGNAGLSCLWLRHPLQVMACSSRRIEDGYQKEVPDNWLKIANPFEIRRDSQRQEVRFGGYTRCETDEQWQSQLFIQEGYQAVAGGSV